MRAPSSSARPASAVTRRRALLLALLAGAGSAGAAPSAGDDTLPLEAARAAIASGSALVFDIREPEEHAQGVAAGMRLLPMSRLGERLGEIPNDPKRPVILVCNTQNRSRAVARALRERGWTHVRYATGGMSDWARRGWPLVAPR